MRGTRRDAAFRSIPPSCRSGAGRLGCARRGHGAPPTLEGRPGSPGRPLVDLGQHNEVRPPEGGYGLPQDPLGDQGLVAEGAGRVDQDRVGVPAQPKVGRK